MKEKLDIFFTLLYLHLFYIALFAFFYLMFFFTFFFSPWRDTSVEENLKKFEKMRTGQYEEGTAFLRMNV
jgi:hypothetical protein